MKVGSLSEMGNSAVLIFKCSSQNLYFLKMSLLLDLEEGCGSGLFLSFLVRVWFPEGRDVPFLERGDPSRL